MEADRVKILNTLARRPPTERAATPLPESDGYEELNDVLRGRVAATAVCALFDAGGAVAGESVQELEVLVVLQRLAALKTTESATESATISEPVRPRPFLPELSTEIVDSSDGDSVWGEATGEATSLPVPDPQRRSPRRP